MSFGCRRARPQNDNGSDIDIVGDGRGFDDVLSERPPGVGFTDERRVRGANFTPVLFGYDSSQITGSEGQKVAGAADYLKRNSGLAIVVEGHCDERGSREYNLSLGERRALAVRAYLIGLGVPAQRIHTRSLGEEQPADPGHDESSWRVNRRGEFLMYR
jgi:peptidoglycan-associated lipoprotein